MIQNNVWQGVNSGIDIKQRIPQIVKEIQENSAFIPEKLVSTSSWWSKDTGVGAFHFNGKLEDESVVLKVQGVKPTTSEILMIEEFTKQNKSSIVRAPKIYAKFPWDDIKKYEAFILEDVSNNLVTDVSEFFDYYKEYRKNCLNKPWLEKPDINISASLKNKFDEWNKLSHKIYPNHTLREPNDVDLVKKGVDILCKNNDFLQLEFVHGHFSARDLYKVGDQIVVLSNLYWSWRTPYYDLIFAYHWKMYDLSNEIGITAEKIETQRDDWLKHIYNIAEDKTLLKYSLLERAIAGLNLDALGMNPEMPISKYIVEKNREIVKKLIEELS